MMAVIMRLIRSRTIQGIIALVAAGVVGDDVGQAVNQLLDAVAAQNVQAAIIALAAVYAAWGRAKAKGPLV